MKLTEIAHLQFGAHYKPQEKGEIAYLQAKHFNFLGQICYPKDSFIPTDKRIEKHLLKDGDVLLTGKGYSNLAWTYKKAFGPAVASTIFFVMRPDLNKVLPEYLTILFNTSKAQAYFQTLGAGSSIPSIRKSELESFPVSMPSLDVQKKIVEINNLHQQEMELMENLINEKDKLFEAIINELINK